MYMRRNKEWRQHSTARSPFTRFIVTVPPAAWIRFSSVVCNKHNKRVHEQAGRESEKQAGRENHRLIVRQRDSRAVRTVVRRELSKAELSERN